MAAMLKNGRHIEFVSGTRTFFLKSKDYLSNCVQFVSQFERFFYFWAVVCCNIGSAGM